jgi:hypothetical protein
MIRDELIAQFKRCEQWQDADQWDALAMMYYQRGYLLNALHCFKRADALRAAHSTLTLPSPWKGEECVAVETEA